MHLGAVSLRKELVHNQWDRPLLSSSPARAADAACGSPASHADPPYALLPPSSYLPFHVPVDLPSSGASEAGTGAVAELPAEYATALGDHVDRLREFAEALDALGCSEQMRADVGAALAARFKAWLVRTGNMRQLNELLRAV